MARPAESDGVRCRRRRDSRHPQSGRFDHRARANLGGDRSALVVDRLRDHAVHAIALDDQSLGAAVGDGNRFAAAGLVTFLPAALFMAAFWLLPETRGQEPEDLWPGT